MWNWILNLIFQFLYYSKIIDGQPGIKGLPGKPGRPGRRGFKGERGISHSLKRKMFFSFINLANLTI